MGYEEIKTGRFSLFGRKSRAEKLKEQAESNSLVPMAALNAAYAGARPVLERLLYDDDLRDNIRTFIESVRSILDELSDEDPQEIITRLWNGEKVRTRGGRGGKLLLLLLVAAVGFLFLNPRTGPQTRKFVGDTYGSLTSGE